MFKSFYTTQLKGNSKQLRARFTKIRIRNGKVSKVMASACALALAAVFGCAVVIMAAVESHEPGIADAVNGQPEFIYPSGGRVVNRYGSRVHPITSEIIYHKGMDIAGELGEPIVAAEGGKVIEAGYDFDDGNHIRIRHNDEFESHYAHCSEITAEVGDVVAKGDIIGRMGQTGRATGVCLHFEIIKNGEQIDPESCLKTDND